MLVSQDGFTGAALKISENGATTPLKTKLELTSPVGGT